ncbi:hypothetical protein SSS_09524 [Sarcoptes scabiei]|uniref:Uncharacterized protein n=1 Tax=Sarcoptes scabiei TaxID=52283 RepID=A0A834RL32_SARSC|nr:hypothetical protein SSS_09524 [Sarcoptes scabiei]
MKKNLNSIPLYFNFIICFVLIKDCTSTGYGGSAKTGVIVEQPIYNEPKVWQEPVLQGPKVWQEPVLQGPKVWKEQVYQEQKVWKEPVYQGPKVWKEPILPEPKVWKEPNNPVVVKVINQQPEILEDPKTTWRRYKTLRKIEKKERWRARKEEKWRRKEERRHRYHKRDTSEIGQVTNLTKRSSKWPYKNQYRKHKKYRKSDKHWRYRRNSGSYQAQQQVYGPEEFQEESWRNEYGPKEVIVSEGKAGGYGSSKVQKKIHQQTKIWQEPIVSEYEQPIAEYSPEEKVIETKESISEYGPRIEKKIETPLIEEAFPSQSYHKEEKILAQKASIPKEVIVGEKAGGYGAPKVVQEVKKIVTKQHHYSEPEIVPELPPVQEYKTKVESYGPAIKKIEEERYEEVRPEYGKIAVKEVIPEQIGTKIWKEEPVSSVEKFIPEQIASSQGGIGYDSPKISSTIEKTITKEHYPKPQPIVPEQQQWQDEPRISSTIEKTITKEHYPKPQPIVPEQQQWQDEPKISTKIEKTITKEQYPEPQPIVPEQKWQDEPQIIQPSYGKKEIVAEETVAYGPQIGAKKYPEPIVPVIAPKAKIHSSKTIQISTAVCNKVVDGLLKDFQPKFSSHMSKYVINRVEPIRVNRWGNIRLYDGHMKKIHNLKREGNFRSTTLGNNQYLIEGTIHIPEPTCEFMADAKMYNRLKFQNECVRLAAKDASFRVGLLVNKNRGSVHVAEMEPLDLKGLHLEDERGNVKNLRWPLSKVNPWQLELHREQFMGMLTNELCDQLRSMVHEPKIKQVIIDQL